MKAYQTDINGFLISETDCQISPLEPNVYLIPGGAKNIKPPLYITNSQIPKWNEKSENWIIVPNFSGRIFYHKITRLEKYFEIEEPFDFDYTDIKPIDGIEFQKFESDSWVEDSVTKLFIMKYRILSNMKSIFLSKIENYRGIVEVDGIQWDSGQKYLTNIKTVISVINNKQLIKIPEWRDATNTNRPVTIDNLTEISNSIEFDIFTKGFSLYAKKWAKESEISELTIDKIDNFDPHIGWD